MSPTDPAADVALVARVLARLGLVHAFGHVSARVPAPRSARVLLTPTFPPLGEVEAADVLELDEGGRVVGGVAEHRPLEAALHLAVYAARPGVGASAGCRRRRSPPSAPPGPRRRCCTGSAGWWSRSRSGATRTW